MKNIMLVTLTSIFLIVPVLARQPDPDYPTVQPKVRFAPLHIYLDSGSRTLAAYQFELKAAPGKPAPAKLVLDSDRGAGVKIVGVEGGEHKAFKEAPYYDNAALHKSNRIIIAAFNTGHDLPQGRTRIATIHLQIIGEAEPDYELKLTVAADANAKDIPAKISFETHLGEGLRRSGKGEQK